MLIDVNVLNTSNEINRVHHVYVIHFKQSKFPFELSIKSSYFSRLTQIPSIEEQGKLPEQCYYCQQQTTAMTTTTTTLNVVINQQTVEQLIQNSLRKLLYPSVM